MSIRPEDHAIVRNHFHNGKWGGEERDGPCIRANESFEIVICAERECFKLMLNGGFLGTFRHRLPLHLIQYIHVSGQVAIDHILIEEDPAVHQHQMPVNPYPINPYPINPYPINPQGDIGSTHYATPSAPPRPIYPQNPQMMVIF